MIWFIQNLERVHLEKNALERIEREAKWLVGAVWQLTEGGLCIDVDIKSHGHTYEARLQFPSAYPACPPAVYPRKKEHWSGHQYGVSGELCLEIGPDNWHSRLTCADMLLSTFKLLETENPKGTGKKDIVPSRHQATTGQRLRSTFFRFLTTDTLIDHINSLKANASGLVEFSTIWHPESLITIVQAIEIQDKWTDPLVPEGIKPDGIVKKGTLFKTAISPDDLLTANLSKLKELLTEEGHDTSCLVMQQGQSYLEKPLILISDANDKLHLFWVYGEKDENCSKFEVLHLDNKDDISRLGQDTGVLQQKRVGIVGLGSAGSKIAISLGRSGIKDFILIDDDIFFPENICRNELDWHHVGQHKVDAVSEKLKLLTPGMKVQVRRLKLSGQEATTNVASALKQLGGCDLIIDATADPKTFNQLASVASEYKTPLVWLEVFEGGIGGLIARYRPGKEPEPHSMRNTFNQLTQEQDMPRLRPAGDYATENPQGRIIVASDADVSAISYNTVRLAIDTVLSREPSSFPYSMYLIGLAREWCFSEPFDTRPIDVGVPSDPKPSGLTDQEKSKTSDFITEIVTKALENSPST